MHELPNLAAHPLGRPVVAALGEAAGVEQLAEEVSEFSQKRLVERVFLYSPGVDDVDRLRRRLAHRFAHRLDGLTDIRNRSEGRRFSLQHEVGFCRQWLGLREVLNIFRIELVVKKPIK